MYLEHPQIKNGMVEVRDYQTNIYNSCKGKNSLIILPTGLGKSACALMLIADKIKEGKCLMMAPTKPLVEQHVSYYRNLLNIDPEDVVLFTGNISAPKRKEAWGKGRLILATPQTIQNDIEKELYTLSDVSLIVFDEVHRCSGDYAYGVVADKYKEQNPAGQLIGMTASPGSDEEKVAEILEALSIEHIISKKESDPDVSPYLHQKDIKPIYFDLPAELSTAKASLIELMKHHMNAIRELGIEGISIPSKENFSMRELKDIKSGIDRAIAQQDTRGYMGASLYAGYLKLKHGVGLAESQGSLPLKKYLYKLYEDGRSSSGSKAGKRLVQDLRFLELYQTAMGWEEEFHPKLRHLPSIVMEELDINPDSKIIVFANYRDTVSVIVSTLKQNGVSANRFVGQSGKAGSDSEGLSQKKQVAVMDKFRNGEFKVLVSTSVGEEGLDVPATNHVIFYEPVPSDTRAIQRRGRTGRFEEGRVSVLITKGTVDETYWNISRKKEEKMRAGVL